MVFEFTVPELQVVCRFIGSGRIHTITYFHPSCYHEAGDPHGPVSPRRLLSVIEGSRAARG